MEIGKVVNEINNPNVRELVTGNYRIIYRIWNKQRVDILMVHHGTRDLASRR